MTDPILSRRSCDGRLPSASRAWKQQSLCELWQKCKAPAIAYLSVRIDVFVEEFSDNLLESSVVLSPKVDVNERTPIGGRWCNSHR